MLRTILEISFTNLWQTGAVDAGPFQLGAGWIMSLVLAVFVISIVRSRLAESLTSEEKRSQLIHVTVLLGIFVFLGIKGPDFFPNGLPVFGYGFMLFIGFISAASFAARRAERVGLSRDLMWDMGMGIIFFGIVGARAFYLIQYHERVFAGQSGMGILKTIVNLPDGGLVFYGGLILAVLGYLYLCKSKKVSPHFLADIIVPSLFIGLAFGRIGCFFNGCCFGDESSLPWAVIFSPESPPYVALMNRGILAEGAKQCIPLHPTQIYSSINAFILAFITTVYFPYRTRDGAVLAIGMILYPISRFTIEFLRSDELGMFNTSFTISQWVSLGLLCFGLIYLFWLSKQPPVLTIKVAKESTAK